MFNGQICSAECDGWIIRWESLDGYRFWCRQEHPSHTKTAAVVMFNPGSLSGMGENLQKDTTLRVLRDIYNSTSYNPFIINLYNLAAAKTKNLFDQWEQRDHPNFNYSGLPLNEFSAVLYAYGDYENKGKYADEIKKRIEEVRNVFANVPEIVVPAKLLNITGTPKHPLSVQMKRLKNEYRQAIINHASKHDETR
jgi:hypothetical protein